MILDSVIPLKFMTEQLKKVLCIFQMLCKDLFHHLNTITDNRCQTSLHVKSLKCTLNRIKFNRKNTSLYDVRNATGNIQLYFPTHYSTVIRRVYKNLCVFEFNLQIKT